MSQSIFHYFIFFKFTMDVDFDDDNDLVPKLSCNYTKIIPVDEIKKYKKLYWGGNGLGDRFAQKKFNYSSIFSGNRIRTYSENLLDEIPKEELERFYKLQTTSSAQGIIGIFVHSKKEVSTQLRPIRKDIQKEITKRLCLNCNKRSDTVCDHKNDLYNDPRVLNCETQILEDFQPLCTSCNLQKRQICIEERRNKKIFSVKDYSTFEEYTFLFPWELTAYDEKDIDCKKGSYWYDIAEFNRKVKQYVKYIIEHLYDGLRKSKKFNDIRRQYNLGKF